MVRDLMALPAIDPESRRVNVIVETPKGCRNKYKYDEDLGLFRLHKRLPAGATFPFDFGFIPSTRADDGDAVDLLLLVDEPTPQGCLVTARLLGVLRAEQTEKGKTIRNDRLIGVAETDKIRPEERTLNDLSKRLLDQIEHFFVSYNQLEGRAFVVTARQGPAAARTLIEQGDQRYRDERTSRRKNTGRAATTGGRS
jgi:inorganic pyrophosphatase